MSYNLRAYGFQFWDVAVLGVLIFILHWFFNSIPMDIIVGAVGIYICKKISKRPEGVLISWICYLQVGNGMPVAYEKNEPTYPTQKGRV